MPFVGVAHVGYIPSADGKITGLSKLARLVDVFARRPQVQERLTTQIADSLMEILEPRGVIVVIECEHMCMTMRGVRKPGAKTTTSAVRGQLRDAATRVRGDEPDTRPLGVCEPPDEPALRILRRPGPCRTSRGPAVVGGERGGAAARQALRWLPSHSRAAGISRPQVLKLWPPLSRMIDEIRLGGLRSAG